MQMSARNAFGARYVFDGRSHDRLAQRSSGLRMLLGPSPPGNMRRSIAPSVVGTPAPHAAAPYRASGLVPWPDSEATADGRDGGLLGSTRRRVDAAGRRWLRPPDAGQQLASSASGIEASSSVAVAKLGVAD